MDSKHTKGRDDGARREAESGGDGRSEERAARPGEDAAVTGTPPVGNAAPVEAAPVPGAAPGAGAPDEMETQLAAMRAEAEDFKGRLLRVSADYQNFVKRTQQNLADARQQQLLDVAKGLVNVLDLLDHALEVDPETATAASLLQGVQMARGEFLKALAKVGVQRIDAEVGEAFDPTRHEALMQQQVEGVAPHHVAAQLQPGYMLGDKTVRPAKVSVAG